MIAGEESGPQGKHFMVAEMRESEFSLCVLRWVM